MDPWAGPDELVTADPDELLEPPEGFPCDGPPDRGAGTLGLAPLELDPPEEVPPECIVGTLGLAPLDLEDVPTDALLEPEGRHGFLKADSTHSSSMSL